MPSMYEVEDEAGSVAVHCCPTGRRVVHTTNTTRHERAGIPPVARTHDAGAPILSPKDKTYPRSQSLRRQREGQGGVKEPKLHTRA